MQAEEVSPPPAYPRNQPDLSADHLALVAIQTGAILVDPDVGTIHRWGVRAELPDPRTGFGQVTVATPNRRAMAHRAVWIAANGLIPAGVSITHDNGRRWDNRLANLVATLDRGHRPTRIPGPDWRRVVDEWIAQEPVTTLVTDPLDPYRYLNWFMRIGPRQHWSGS